MNHLARRNMESLMGPSISGLDQLLKGFFVRPVDFEGAGILKVDIHEDENNYRIHAELPGIAKENINVQIEGDVVSISAENKREKETREGEKVIHSERYHGRVSRSFRLANDVNEDACKASFNDGVLELVLPKKAEGTGRTHLRIE